MKRILPAFVMAVLIHAVLLTMDTGWLIRRPPTPPRTQVLTMQLVSRVPFSPAAMNPLPASPPPLPPEPEKSPVEKPVTKPKPVVKKPAALKKKPSEKVVPIPTPPVPAPEMAIQEPKTQAPPSVEKAKPAASDPPPAPVPPPFPAAPGDSDRTPRETANVSAAMVMATPRYSENPPPEYPAIARRRGYQGTVILEVFVKESGRVGNLRIAESSSHSLLDKAALKAVKRWKFQPGRRQGLPVAMWIRVPVDFRLE